LICKSKCSVDGNCRGLVNDTYRMDLILIHPPFLITLACIYIASVHKEKDIRTWFEELSVDMNIVSLCIVINLIIL